MLTLLLLFLLAVALQASYVSAHGNDRSDHDDDDDHHHHEDFDHRRGVRGSTCNCNDAECSIVEKLKVGSLCADDICIGGASVITGDGNPCTTDDVDANGNAVHALVPNCCTNSTGCAQFSPGDCFHSECIIASGKTTGTCLHQRLPDGQCCSNTVPCPQLPCQKATCLPVNATTLASVRVKRNDGNYHKVFANEAVISLTGQCNYTATDKKCCTSEDDCTCPDDTEAVCQVPGVCKCLSTCHNECRADSDCPPLDVDHPHWAENPCIVNRCILGFCRPVKDENADKDHDGIKCKFDCDDNDPKNGTAIFCTVENTTTVDVDGDGIPRCGAEVNKTCSGKCAAGKLEVSEADLSRAVFHDNHFFVDKNCDCCDRNASGIDSRIFCGVNNDSDALFDPILKLAPNGRAVNSSNCLEEFCVVLGPFKNANQRADLADAECVRELGNDNSQSFDVNDPPPCGDHCPADPEIQDPLAFCPVQETINGSPRSVCNITLSNDVAAGTTDCCEELLARNALNIAAGLDDPFQEFVDCCKSLPNDLSQVNFSTACTGPNQGSFPLQLGVCECNQTTLGTLHACNGFDAAITCVRDNDRDCYYDCADPVDLCVNFPKTITNSIRDKCNIDKSTLPSALTEDQLCCITGIEKGAPYRSLADAEGSSGHDFCDCNDEDKTAFQLIPCIRDADQDTFPACFANGTEQCSAVCAASCDVARGGPFTDPSKITCGVKATPPPPPNGKRSLDSVKEVIASHNWYNKRSVLLPGKSKCPNKDCVNKPTRVDQLCSGFEICNSGSQVLACDCCDKDCVVYPGSPYASGSRNKCSTKTGAETDRSDIVGHDYNCDGFIQKFVAAIGATVLAPKDTTHCPSTVSDSRQIFTITDIVNVVQTDAKYNSPTADAAVHDVTHTGCDPVDNTACTPIQPGFDTNPAYVVKKRATVTVPGPTWCVNKQYDPAGAAAIILFNQCAQFSRTCTQSNNTEMANPDPDLCGVAHEVVLLIGD